MNIPSYGDVNLQGIDLICGFYSLGLIEKYFPKIKIIDACQWRVHKSGDRYGGMGYEWLSKSINKWLNDDKLVLVIPEDEDVMHPHDPRLTVVLNQNIDNNLYFVSQMSHHEIYRDVGIKCKMLELPWIMVNDCMCYHAMVGAPRVSPPIIEPTYNFITFIYRRQRHKLSLLKNLCTNNVAQYGLMTLSCQDDYDDIEDNVKAYCSINKNPPYADYNKYANGERKHPLYDDNIIGFNEGGFYKINGIWISTNVNNFITMNKEYHNIPLVINPETTTGIFPMTEKSVWPILLGKLFIIHGHQGIMSEIQRFYDIDISDFVNLEFDSMCGWGDETDELRVQMMINDNKNLIINAPSIYNDVRAELDKSSYSFGENMYKFFISQIQSIYSKETSCHM